MKPRLLFLFSLAAFLCVIGIAEVRAQAPSELFISEYVEGTSNNKALEFYNGTGVLIDLTAGNYVVQYYFNGATTVGTSINLTGTVANNGVFVLAQSLANASILAVANQTSSASWHNGDDAIVLRKGGASGTIIDVIGQVGFDPGTEWGTGLQSTADNTLRRKTADCIGDNNSLDVFDPATKYDGFATDVFTGLGSHTSSCSVAGAPITINPLSLNFTTTVGLSSAQQTYTVQGNALTNDITVTSSLTNFGLSLVSGGPYSSSVTIPVTLANAGPVSVYVVYTPTNPGTPNGSINHTSGSAGATLSVQGIAQTPGSFTPIYTIQGTGTASPLLGTVVTTEGIVTGDFQGTNQLNGFYIQDTTGDGNTSTSDGILIFNTSFPVNVGDYVRITGTVAEFFNLTEITTVTATTILSSGNTVIQPVDVNLPVAAITDLERYEGMLVRFPQTLTATETFTLGRFGEVALSVNGRLFNPTNFVDPNDNPASGTNSTGTSNVAAVTAQQDLNNRSRILLDDGSNVQNPPVIPFLNPADTTLRIGSTIANLTGILSYDFSKYRLQPTAVPSFNYAPRPAVPSVGNSDVKIASFNVLNYFNGDGLGGGFPTSRGADSLSEFIRQRTKIIKAISTLNADAVGLIEIENDGNGAQSAIADLVNGLNAVMGAGIYAFVADPVAPNGNTGTDQIKVAIIYKPSKLTTVGLSKADTDPVHNRPPLAQTFTVNANGEKFTLIVNHFKSKSCTGATGANADQLDGQGCYNSNRKLQAQALLTFINSLQTSSGDADIISVGDYNAYEEEDPMDILRAGGLTNVFPGTYSYVFDGQSGSLDNALVTSTLLNQVSGVDKWHINADEPIAKSYDQQFNPPYAYSPDAFRSSDHDPVLVGLSLGNIPPVITITSPTNNTTLPAGSAVTLTANATDADGTITKVEFYVGGVKFAEDLSAPYTLTGTNVEAGTYVLTAKAFDNSGDSALSTTVTITLTACSGGGAITGEGYLNINGTQVADLIANPNYPNNPSITVPVTSFEYASVGDSYGARLRGYICAPQTGNYTFYIAGDDQAGLWLSTDENPANKVLIAYNISPVGFRDWTATTTQQSAPITLTKGVRYYIETLHKQNIGTNHLSVGWVLPDGSAEGPIPGNRLSPIGSSFPNIATTQSFGEAMQDAINKDALKVTVAPNPSSSYFTFNLSGSSKQTITIIIRDVAGRVLTTVNNQSANSTIKIGAALKAGVYFAEVLQGKERLTLKLVKQ
jgi:uncharacterized protein